jgi:hypothetical protein
VVISFCYLLLTMLQRFGPQAVPKLWSGVLLYGDSAGTLVQSSARGR